MPPHSTATTSASSQECIPNIGSRMSRLLIMGGIAALFCLLRLADVIAALVVIRIIIQFLAQIVGVIVLRSPPP